MHSIEEYVSGFFVPLGFYPGFSYRATYHRCIFCRFFLVSCYANFFTYVTAPALKSFDYAYLYNAFPVNRYISIYIFRLLSTLFALHIDVHVLSIWFHKLVHSVRLCWLIKRWSILSEGTMHESRTRLCRWCCLALARGLRRVVMNSCSHSRLLLTVSFQSTPGHACFTRFNDDVGKYLILILNTTGRKNTIPDIGCNKNRNLTRFRSRPQFFNLCLPL